MFFFGFKKIEWEWNAGNIATLYATWANKNESSDQTMMIDTQ